MLGNMVIKMTMMWMVPSWMVCPCAVYNMNNRTWLSAYILDDDESGKWVRRQRITGGEACNSSILHSHRGLRSTAFASFSLPLAGDSKFGPVYLHAFLGLGPASWKDAP